MTSDSTATLKVIGIIQIILGGLGLLFGLTQMAITSSLMAANAPAGVAVLVGGVGLVIYGVGGGTLVALGIGTVRVRPWARLMGIISSSLVLALGGLASIGMLAAFFVGGVGKAELVILALGFGFFFVLFVALPTVFLVIYTRPSVRATFEARR